MQLNIANGIKYCLLTPSKSIMRTSKHKYLPPSAPMFHTSYMEFTNSNKYVLII